MTIPPCSRENEPGSVFALLESLQLGSYTLYFMEHARIVLIDKRQIHLTPLEYTIFRALVAQPGMLLLNSDLLLQCKGMGSTDASRLLKRHIDNLRQKLRQSGLSGLRILRVVSNGYVLLPYGEDEGSS